MLNALCGPHIDRYMICEVMNSEPGTKNTKFILYKYVLEIYLNTLFLSTHSVTVAHNVRDSCDGKLPLVYSPVEWKSLPRINYGKFAHLFSLSTINWQFPFVMEHFLRFFKSEQNVQARKNRIGKEPSRNAKQSTINSQFISFHPNNTCTLHGWRKMNALLDEMEWIVLLKAIRRIRMPRKPLK